MAQLAPLAVALAAVCLSACDATAGAAPRSAPARVNESTVGSAAQAGAPATKASDAAPKATGAASASTAITPSKSAEPAPTQGLTVLLGGDVSFGRSVGQRVLQDPTFDPFAALEPWLRVADVRVVNLESVLSDTGGVTEHPGNRLVFSGPPAAAQVLARAGIDVVSAANNHSWDYGKKGLTESLGLLQRAGLRTMGASATAGHQYDPVIIERNGLRIALLAFTQVWNDGKLEDHPARTHVAGPDYESMKRALRRAREQADFVIASLHASNEYVPIPRERARRFARALLVSGADLVFGHHPHVVQGLEWIGDEPILYSLGNLVFDSRQDRPETRAGAVALVHLERRDAGVAVAAIELCPVSLEDALPTPAPVGPLTDTVQRLSKPLGGLETVPGSTTGCFGVGPSATPLPYSKRHGFAPDPLLEGDGFAHQPARVLARESDEPRSTR